MNTLKIYYGAEKPFAARGKNQCNLLNFAFHHPGWHTLGNCRATKRAAARLAEKGCIVLSENQFKINR